MMNLSSIVALDDACHMDLPNLMSDRFAIANDLLGLVYNHILSLIFAWYTHAFFGLLTLLFFKNFMRDITFLGINIFLS